MDLCKAFLSGNMGNIDSVLNTILPNNASNVRGSEVRGRRLDTATELIRGTMYA